TALRVGSDSSQKMSSGQKLVPVERNSWAYWRPVYHFTWALAQSSSYRHYRKVLSTFKGKVLDIGTGTGEYISTLPTVNTYTFTDVDSGSLAVAEERARSTLQSGTYKIVRSDGLDALRANPHQDLISIIHVISVVPDPHQ